MSFGDVGMMLLIAAHAGDLPTVDMLLKQGVDASYQEKDKGQSALMLAAQSGNKELVKTLLEHGAPWNALDKRDKCAGQYAMKAGHDDIVNLLVRAGVTAELLFAKLEKKSKIVEAQATMNNKDYIQRQVQYDGDDLIDSQQRGVMMMWEKPLMKAHAEFMCRSGGDVINFGFGLGLVDTAIQEHNPRTHTIVEAHPIVYKRMLDEGWDKKPNVRIIHSRWQDALDELGTYDGIFFDTFDDVLSMHEFHVHLPKLLKKGGVYSFFNGICPENQFFHMVACQVIEVQLEELGFNTTYEPVPIDCSSDDIWDGVKFRYFESNEYNFPVCTWQDAPPTQHAYCLLYPQKGKTEEREQEQETQPEMKEQHTE